MSTQTLKSFAALHDDYAFFEAHATEVEGTLAAWLPRVKDRWEGLHALDFGAGSGSFTSTFLQEAGFAPESLRLTLVEPDAGFRQEALQRLSSFTSHPIEGWPLLDRDLEPTFDLIFSHHVLYYVPDLKQTIRRLIGALKPRGQLLLVQGGASNGLNQLVWAGFARVGEKAPYHYSEDTARALNELNVSYSQQTVHRPVKFPDSVDNRQRILRFLLGEHLAKLASEQALELFTPYVCGDTVRIDNADELFIIDG